MTGVLEPGTYVCVKTRTLAGVIIRAFTRSAYDHAFLIAGDGKIVESTPRRGVHVSPLGDYAGCRAVADTGEAMRGAQRAAVLLAARSCVGDPYGWADIACIFLRRLGLRWGWLIREAGDGHALICSELVALSGRAAGLDWLCGETSAASVTPADLARRPGVEPVTI